MIINHRALLLAALALPVHAFAGPPHAAPPQAPQYGGLPPELQALAGVPEPAPMMRKALPTRMVIDDDSLEFATVKAFVENLPQMPGVSLDAHESRKGDPLFYGTAPMRALENINDPATPVGTRVVTWIVALSAQAQGPLVGRMEAQVLEDAAGQRFVQQRSALLCEAAEDVCARLRVNREQLAEMVNSDE